MDSAGNSSDKIPTEMVPLPPQDAAVSTDNSIDEAPKETAPLPPQDAADSTGNSTGETPTESAPLPPQDAADSTGNSTGETPKETAPLPPQDAADATGTGNMMDETPKETAPLPPQVPVVQGVPMPAPQGPVGQPVYQQGPVGEPVYQYPLRHEPTSAKCPTCSEMVVTEVRYEAGAFTWLLAGGIAWFILPCCACIPCCFNRTKDAVHYCPVCQTMIGRHNAENTQPPKQEQE